MSGLSDESIKLFGTCATYVAPITRTSRDAILRRIEVATFLQAQPSVTICSFHGLVTTGFATLRYASPCFPMPLVTAIESSHGKCASVRVVRHKLRTIIVVQVATRLLPLRETGAVRWLSPGTVSTSENAGILTTQRIRNREIATAAMQALISKRRGLIWVEFCKTRGFGNFAGISLGLWVGLADKDRPRDLCEFKASNTFSMLLLGAR